MKRDYRTTLKELLGKYEENYRQQRSFTTWKGYCLENFKANFGEDCLLSAILYVDLESYRNQLTEKPTRNRGLRTDAGVNREMSCLHHLFSKAVEWEMMERSPFERGKTLLLKENNKRLRFLSDEEIQRLLAECPKHLRRIMECGIHSGMRRGEILSLRWEQIRNGQI